MSTAPFVTKDDLLSRLEGGRAEFLGALLVGVPEAELTQPNAVGNWSIADLIAHFIAHEQRALAELRAALRGEVYPIDHDSNDAFNAESIARYRGQSFGMVRMAWLASTDSIIAEVEQLTPQEYDPAGPVCVLLDDSIDGALGNNTYGHCVEHLPEVQAWLRARI